MKPLFFILFLVVGCTGESVGVTPDPEILDPSITALPEDPPASRLVVSPSFRTLEVGSPLQLRPLLVSGGGEVKDLAPGEVVWDSADPETATVDLNGQVTTLKAGRITIRGSWRDQTAASYLVIREVSPVPADPGGDSPPPDEPAEETDPPAEVEAACGPIPAGADRFVDAVVSYELGINGGYREGDLPEIVLGPPHAHPNAPHNGSLDVFSLGKGGEIVLEFQDSIPCDGDGPDFIVFENPFQVGDNPQNTFAEPGIVGVSADGIDFVEFPCQPEPPYAGCAGVRPVLANPDLNDLDPTDPDQAGGDRFGLAELGVASARFLRIRDAGLGLGPAGPGTAGFDLDAVAAVHVILY